MASKINTTQRNNSMDYEAEYKKLMQKKRGYDAAYRMRHKEEVRNRFQAWYQKNKEQIAQRRKQQRLQRKAALASNTTPA